VDLYIVPHGGCLPSDILKSGLQSYLEEKKMVNDILTVMAPEYVSIDIEGTIYVKATYVRTVVEVEVLKVLDNFFAHDSDYVDFGRGIFLSDLYRLLDEVEGVDHVDLNPQMTNITLGDNEFPQKGTVNLNFSGGS
jgi:phage-related baseplate assembly protein